MKCKKCEFELTENANICPNCGNLLGEMEEGNYIKIDENDVIDKINVKKNINEIDGNKDSIESNKDNNIEIDNKNIDNEKYLKKINKKEFKNIFLRCVKNKKILCLIGVFIFVIGICIAIFTGKLCVIHTWKEATCKRPMICEKCGKTKGKPEEHIWKEATCTESKKCKKCNVTEGKALGHKESGLKVVKEATVDSVGEKQNVCTRCGKVFQIEPEYYYDITELEIELYTNVLDIYNSIKEIHMNPDSVKLLGAVTFKGYSDRITVYLSFVGGDEQRHFDYFWKDIDDNYITNQYGIDNYKGTFRNTEELDIKKILYFSKTDLYQPTIISSSCIKIY